MLAFDRRAFTKTREDGLPVLVGEASTLRIEQGPMSFSMEGTDGNVYLFQLMVTEFDGTPDNEVTGWRYQCRKLYGRMEVLIIND